MKRLLYTLLAAFYQAAAGVSGPLPGQQQERPAPRVQVVSWRPRVFFAPGFLSAEEADTMVALARPRMMRSTVSGSGGGGVVDNIRTSYGAFLRRLSHPVVTDLAHKLSAWTHLNVSHQEDAQVLRYGVGQEYGAHMDTLAEGSSRVCTAIIYLADTHEGGETAFPLTTDENWVDPAAAARLGPWSECANGHVAVKPRKGDAVLFYTFNPDGSEDRNALHTGCPVLKGIKWTATVWIHAAPFRPEDLDQEIAPLLGDELGWDPGRCEDMHESCGMWAAAGECQANAGYMLGRDGSVGFCRRACADCEACARGDAACAARNRLAAGYLPLDGL